MLLGVLTRCKAERCGVERHAHVTARLYWRRFDGQGKLHEARRGKLSDGACSTLSQLEVSDEVSELSNEISVV